MDNKKVFEIPIDNFGYFVARMGKLSKRATKLGCSTNLFEVQYPIFNSKNELVGYAVTILGEAPRLDGADFLASIEHTEHGNIIKSFSEISEDVFNKYKNVKADCAHCAMTRYRKKSYLVTRNGEVLQVGSNCLKDFIGHRSPELIAFICTIIKEVEDASGEEYSAGRGEFMVDVDTFLLNACKAYNNFGWGSSTNTSHASTAGIAWDWFFPRYEKGKRVNEPPVTTKADTDLKDEVKAFLVKLSENENLSGFLFNLRVAFLKGLVTYHTKGILGAAVIAYVKDQEKQVKYRKHESEWSKKVEASKYFGEVGKRYQLKVQLTKRRQVSVSSAFTDTLYIYEFTSENGEVFTWFTSKRLDEIEGQVEIKATIKAHDEYKGLKQNKVSRVTIF